MAQRVTATFNDRDSAERAADALVDLGANRTDISILSRNDDPTTATTATAQPAKGHPVIEPAREVGDSGAPLTTADESDAAAGAATGAGIGLVAGAIAAAAVLLTVPGIGPVLASGPLAWAIGGTLGTAAAGAIVGGVYGALHDIGIEETQARHYEARVRAGRVLMTALIAGLSETQVRDVLNEYGAEDINFTTDLSRPAAETTEVPAVAAGTSGIATDTSRDLVGASAASPATPGTVVGTPTGAGTREMPPVTPGAAPVSSATTTAPAASSNAIQESDRRATTVVQEEYAEEEDMIEELP